MLELEKFFKIFQSACKLILKIFEFCDKNKFANIARAIITLIMIYILFVEIYIKNNFYRAAKSDGRIYKEITNLVKECGLNSFVSWAVIDDSILKFSKRTFIFKNIVGCINNLNCGISIKNLNAIYEKEYILSYDDFDFLKKIEQGSIFKYDIIDGHIVPMNANDEYIPQILSHLISSTKTPLKNIKFTVIRDYKNSLVYIFSLSFAKQSAGLCSSATADALLNNLIMITKQNI